MEEKFLLPANQPVDSIQANLLQQETDSVDSKQKQWISGYPSITYPLKSIKVTSPYGYRRDPITGKQSWHNGLDLSAGGMAEKCVDGDSETDYMWRGRIKSSTHKAVREKPCQHKGKY